MLVRKLIVFCVHAKFCCVVHNVSKAAVLFMALSLDLKPNTQEGCHRVATHLLKLLSP